jgi:hypothetical protein
MKIPPGLMLPLASVVVAVAGGAEPGAAGPARKAGPPRIVLPSEAAPAPPPPAGEGRAPKTAPGKTAKAPQKAEEMGKIAGIEIPRGKGFLGIQIVESTFRLSFYDEKKKPVPADLDRAALRWDPKYKVGEERVVLTRTEDGKSLGSPKNIRPPYNFKLFITLIKDAAEGQAPVNETVVIDFRQ